MRELKSMKLNAQSLIDVRKLAGLARHLHKQGYHVNEIATVVSACVDKVYSSLIPKLEEFELDSEAYRYLLDSGFRIGSDRQKRAVQRGLQAESIRGDLTPSGLTQNVPSDLAEEIKSKLRTAEEILQQNLKKGESELAKIVGGQSEDASGEQRD